MTTEERLDLLERRVVLQRRGLFLSWALLGILAALPAAADKEPPPVTRFDQIVANGITVVSPEGKNLVRISSLTNATGLVTTYGPAGKELVRLGSTTDGDGVVTTYSPAGKKLVTLGALDGGGGSMTISDKSGTPLLGTGTQSTTGEGHFIAYNRAGKPRAMWP